MNSLGLRFENILCNTWPRVQICSQYFILNIRNVEPLLLIMNEHVFNSLRWNKSLNQNFFEEVLKIVSYLEHGCGL